MTPIIAHKVESSLLPGGPVVGFCRMKHIIHKLTKENLLQALSWN